MNSQKRIDLEEQILKELEGKGGFLDPEKLEIEKGLTHPLAERIALRYELRQAKGIKKTADSATLEKITQTLLEAAERRIAEDFQDDALYRGRLFLELDLLKKDAHLSMEHPPLLGLYLGYVLKQILPLEYFGDAWATGHSLVAYLLGLTSFNPIALEVPFEYFEQGVLHHDYWVRILVDERALFAKSLALKQILAPRGTELLYLTESTLFRMSPLWIHPRKASSLFAQVAQEQSGRIDPHYLEKIPLDNKLALRKAAERLSQRWGEQGPNPVRDYGKEIETFGELIRGQAYPISSKWEGDYLSSHHVKTKDLGFSLSPEELFKQLFERSGDPAYAYEMSWGGRQR